MPVSPRSSAKTKNAEALPLRGRYPNVNSVRFVVALGVVWIHTLESPELVPWARIGSFSGAAFFVCASLFFMVRSLRLHPHRAWSEYAQSRFFRLYVPFMVWTALYFMMRLAKTLVVGGEGPYFGSHLLIVGSVYHLWFLPYILIVSLLAYPLIRWTIRNGKELPIACFLFAMAPVLGMAEYVTDEPIRRWRYAASRALDMSPTVVLALGFALVYPRIPASFWRLPRLLPYVLGLCFILLVYHTMQQEGPLIIGLAAMACLIGALSLPTSPTTEWMARLGRLGFGVYLVHVAIIEGLQTLWLMTGRTITWQADLLVFALTVPLSFVFAWVLARTAIGRWLVPM